MLNGSAEYWHAGRRRRRQSYPELVGFGYCFGAAAREIRRVVVAVSYSQPYAGERRCLYFAINLAGSSSGRWGVSPSVTGKSSTDKHARVNELCVSKGEAAV